jgi:putative MATE family efflux protein
MKKLFDPVKGKTIPVFFYYSIPSVLSMLALSCAVIIDGFFIGNYSGSDALAAVNLTVPISAFMIGISLMLSVGGAVKCGQYIGKRNLEAANRTFSQTIMLIILVSISFSFLGLLFTDNIAGLLGANEVIKKQTTEYMRLLITFNLFSMGMVCLSCFLRLDGFPVFASIIMICGSLLNIFLDWVFIVKLGMGHKGAALGTGLSEMMTFLFLCPPFILKYTRLKFGWNISGLSDTIRAAFNGIAEFSNEVSAGLITFVFNWIIMARLGESGVAAFSVINYVIICGLMINCGISESIQPVVSKNYGAMKAGRITDFLSIATATVFAAGVTMSGLLILLPGAFTGFFIQSGDKETIALATVFMAKIWPVFLLSGINIVFSAYLTAMNRAFHSTLVSLARNLLFPLIFLMTLPLLTGNNGIFIALPLSELVTFFMVIYLVKKNNPARLILKKAEAI